ncbi:MAG: FtsX-like permease family protein [Firmicutes bacterium]|nr:FtsX-like permease family protein [Bacillota bacterium]
MSFLESLRTAVSCLAANKLRSFLTMLGIIIGVGSVVAMVSIGEGARHRVTSSIGSLGSNLVTVMPGRVRALPGMAFGARGSPDILTYSHYLELKEERLPGVASITAQSSVRKVARHGKNNATTTVVGTTPEYCEINNFKVERGRFISDYDLNNMTRVVVLGRTVAADLFGSAENVSLGATIRLGDVNFTIVGLMEEKRQGWRDLGDQVFVPLTTAQKRLSGSRYIQSIGVQALTPQDTGLVAAGLERFFMRRLGDPEKFSITNQQDVLQTVENATNTLTLLLAGITGISLLVGGIGVMNIMLVSVAERTREIGIRKAIGAKPLDILGQFVIEASMLSSLGGIVGIILGIAGSRGISHLGGWSTVVSIRSVAIALAVSVGVGLFFGIYPAQRAGRLNPIEALRYE